MSLNDYFTNTWYMKLARERDSREKEVYNMPSHKDLDSRLRSLVSNNYSHESLNPDFMRIAGMDRGEYLKAKMGHYPTKMFSKKQIKRIQNSFRTGGVETEASEAGEGEGDGEAEGEGDGEGDAEEEGAGVEGEAGGASGSGVGDEGLNAEARDAIRRTVDVLAEIGDGSVARKEVFEPMNTLYEQLDLGIKLKATGRNGAELTLDGSLIKDVDDEDTLTALKEALTRIRKEFTKKSLGRRRIETDLGTVKKQLKVLALSPSVGGGGSAAAAAAAAEEEEEA